MSVLISTHSEHDTSIKIILFLQDIDKYFARDTDASELFHLFLSFLLFLEEFFLACYIPSIEFRGNIFSHRRKVFSCDHIISYHCLDDHSELFTRDCLFQLITDTSSDEP